MPTPAELLCDRSWRLRNSLWMLPVFLTAGLFAWLSFLIIGVRSRRGLWLGLAAGAFVLSLPLYVMNAMWGDDQKGNTGNENITGAYGAAVWLATIVVALLQNKPWLTWLAEQKGTAGAAGGPAAGAPPSTAALDAAMGVPPTAGAVAAPTASLGSAAPPPSSRLDLNTASADQIQSALGLDPAWATHVVSVRDRVGGFSSTDQLMTDASLPPHVYAGLRDRVDVSPIPDRSGPPSGRRLEL